MTKGIKQRSTLFDRKEKIRWSLAWLAVLLTVLAIYWPGLYGGYIFDDYTFLVDNSDLQGVTSLDLGEWTRAILSFPASHQGRWLTMFTFAANHYFTGFDPFWIKLTNLVIHLLNGCLLYRLFLGLFAWRQNFPHALAPNQRTLHATALALAALWLVLPINLTGVLYSVQRLESFSNTFVLLGLTCYVHGRWQLERTGKGYSWLLAALLAACTGVLAKESAVLLPLYTFLIEWVFDSFRTSRQRRLIKGIYAIVLVLPLFAGLVWLASWIGTETSYARDFNTVQRLLTEARVLVAYMQWALLPLPHSLSLYHDDFAVSQGLFSPPTTVLAIVFLAALAIAALIQHKRHPLFSLGILWFFAGHALTATVIPLELVFEHRNYFPSCGLLLAVGSLLVLEPFVRIKITTAGMVAVAAFAFYAFNTNLRAREWSHPIRLALAEASIRPNSPRAQYELGRALFITAQFNPESPYWNEARNAFGACTKLPKASVICEQGLIAIAARRKEPIDPALWDSIIAKLHSSTPTSSDATAMAALYECQLNDVCPHDFVHLGEALQAGVDHPQPNELMLTIYSEYAWLILRDLDLAERVMREIVALKPRSPDSRANLIAVLAQKGQMDEARAELSRLEAMNHFGALDDMLVPLRKATVEPTASSAVGIDPKP